MRIRTYREDLRTRKREKTSESYFVFVAIDEERRPTAVPQLTVNIDEGERLRREVFDNEYDGR